jgi:osmotically-inducible protein OsmY
LHRPHVFELCESDAIMLKQFALSLVIAGSCSSFAMAQLSGVSNGSGGSQAYGAFGNRTLGGGLGTASNSGSSFSSGQSGSATGGGTSSGLGTSSSGTNNAGGQITGNERFLRQNRNGAFVGADSGDTTNVFSQQQQQQTQALNSMFGQQGLFSQLNRQAQQNLRNQNQGPGKKPLRIPMRAEIELTSAPSSATVGLQLESRMRKLPALAKLGEIDVAMQGRTAILAGRVPTERAKRLAEGVAMLEPGVSDVQNDLIVDPAASKVEGMTPAN